MIDYEFKVESNAAIDVRIVSGRVEIASGEPGSIKVEVDTADPKFKVEQRGGHIHISSDKETRWSSRATAQVVVHVPDGTDATVSTASADIESSASLGDASLKTASGDIELATVNRGSIKSASGDTSLERVNDYVKVSSASGDIHIGQCLGKAEFQAASGDIHINDCSGSVSASTASGDITLSRFTGDRASFKSMSGTASIGVPPGTKLDLDATLLSGQLNLPKPTEENTPSERRMKISAKIVSGDLTIRRVEG